MQNFQPPTCGSKTKKPNVQTWQTGTTITQMSVCLLKQSNNVRLSVFLYFCELLYPNLNVRQMGIMYMSRHLKIKWTLNNLHGN